MIETAVVFVSHSVIASAFVDAIEMVAGEQNNVYSVGLNEAETASDLDAALEKLKLEQYIEVCIFVDLVGGSPFQVVAQKYKEDKRIKIIAGVNFPMALETVLTRNFDTEHVIETGKSGIIDVTGVLNKVRNDDF